MYRVWTENDKVGFNINVEQLAITWRNDITNSSNNRNEILYSVNHIATCLMARLENI